MCRGPHRKHMVWYPCQLRSAHQRAIMATWRLEALRYPSINWKFFFFAIKWIHNNWQTFTSIASIAQAEFPPPPPPQSGNFHCKSQRRWFCRIQLVARFLQTQVTRYKTRALLSFRSVYITPNAVAVRMAAQMCVWHWFFQQTVTSGILNPFPFFLLAQFS